MGPYGMQRDRVARPQSFKTRICLASPDSRHQFKLFSDASVPRPSPISNPSSCHLGSRAEIFPAGRMQPISASDLGLVHTRSVPEETGVLGNIRRCFYP